MEGAEWIVLVEVVSTTAGVSIVPAALWEETSGFSLSSATETDYEKQRRLAQSLASKAEAKASSTAAEGDEYGGDDSDAEAAAMHSALEAMHKDDARGSDSPSHQQQQEEDKNEDDEEATAAAVVSSAPETNSGAAPAGFRLL